MLYSKTITSSKTSDDNTGVFVCVLSGVDRRAIIITNDDSLARW